MADRSPLEDALDKFERAMQTFEGSAVGIKRRLETGGTAAAEVHALREDRSRLAAELDRAKAELSDRDRVNAEAARRMDAAMATISGIVERGDSG